MADNHRDFTALLQDIRAGSEEAACELLETYGPSIITVVRRYLRQRLRALYDSRDFEQDVWASFFANPPDPEQVNGPEALIGFLIAMAKNKVADAGRRNLGFQKRNLNRQKSLDGSACRVVDAVAEQGPTPSATAAAKERWEALSSRDRCILELLCEGKRREQVAAELGISVKTLHRALHRLMGEHAS